MHDSYDVLVAGAGPAGSEFAFRMACLGYRVLVLEKGALDREKSCGGGIQTQEIIEFGPLPEDVVEVDLSISPFIVKGSKTHLETNALIIATGAQAKRLEIPGAGDDEFWQKGVSTCAICDGAAPIFKDKHIYIVGGGDSAVEESLFLTKFASKVFIVHRRDKLRASKIMAIKAMNHPKIEILWNSEVVEILGDKIVTHVVIKNSQTNKEEKREAGGVFFAIGHTPNTAFLKGQLTLNEKGYILVKKGSSYTNKEGVFAAGDVQDFVYRQAVTAAGFGCMAALDAQRWLEEGFSGI